MSARKTLHILPLKLPNVDLTSILLDHNATKTDVRGNYDALRYIKRFYGISYEHSLGEIIEMNTGMDPGTLPSDVFKPESGAAVSNIATGFDNGDTSSGTIPVSNNLAVADVSMDLRRRIGI